MTPKQFAKQCADLAIQAGETSICPSDADWDLFFLNFSEDFHDCREFETEYDRLMSAHYKKNNAAFDDEWRREIAMEAGMCLGVEAYNDHMGWSWEYDDE